MTLEKALRLAGLMEPGHVVDEELLIEFLNELEGLIQVEIMLLAHEEVVVYTSEDKGKELLLRAPHDRIYVHYLAGMIRMVNREFEDYNNQQAVVDEKLRGFKRWFIQTYRPADTHCRDYINQTPGTVGQQWRGYYLTAYGIAVKHGFAGSETEWLASLKGDTGEAGEPALMRYDPESGYVQWQNRGDAYWQDLIQVAQIVDAAAAAAAQQATTEAAGYAETACHAADEAKLMASHADDAARRAEEAAEQAVNAGVSEQYVADAIKKLREDMEYEPITITSIAIQPSVAQLGQVIENPTLTWALSREPVKQVVSGVEVDPALRRCTLERVFDGTNSAGLTVTDERGATDTKSAKMNFYNGVYYSYNWPEQKMPTDEELQKTIIKLQGGPGMTINARAGLGQYILYSCPSRYGRPEFWANGFQGGFSKVGSFLHTNRFGYAENYDVYISNARGLNVTITVKEGAKYGD